MRVKPAPGLKVRFPYPAQKRVLSSEGAEVPEDSYWLRRLRSGDVVPVEHSPDSPGEVE